MRTKTVIKLSVTVMEHTSHVKQRLLFVNVWKKWIKIFFSCKHTYNHGRLFVHGEKRKTIDDKRNVADNCKMASID